MALGAAAFKAQDNRTAVFGTNANFKLAYNSATGKFELVNAADTALLSVNAVGTLIPKTSATAGAGLNLAHGAAPTSPVNGDVWTTTAGVYVRVNGATVGPLVSAAGVDWTAPGTIGSVTPNTVRATRIGVGLAVDADILLYTQTATSTYTPLFDRNGQTSDALWFGARSLATKTTNMGNGFGAAWACCIKDDAGVVNVIGVMGAVRAGADNTGNIVLRPYSANTPVESFILSPTTGLTLLHDLVVQGNDIDGVAGAFNLLATPTWVVMGAAATLVDIGAATGTCSIYNAVTSIKGLTQAGPYICTPSATQNITAAGGITTAMLLLGYEIRVAGNGGAIDITANPQIADGTNGQIIEIAGTHDTNTLKLDDGTGLKLVGAASITLGKGDRICLTYNASDDLWYERFRASV